MPAPGTTARPRSRRCGRPARAAPRRPPARRGPSSSASARSSRSRGGMSSNSASIESTPIVREHLGAVIVGGRGVTAHGSCASYALGVHQRLGLRGVRQLDLDQPALAVGVLVDRLGLVAERLVDGDDLARQRRDHVGDRLDRLDLGVGLVLGHLRADLGRLEEHDLAERVLGVPGDPERRLIAVDPGPVVLGVVQQSSGIAGVGHRQDSFRYRGFGAITARLLLPLTSISKTSPGSARSAATYAIPIPRSRHGEKVPLVTSPPPITGLPWRAIPGPSISNATSFSAGPARARRGHGLGADESGLLGAAPAETRLDRAAILAEVVAVQVKAGLEPQRVAGAEPRRGRARLEQRVPHGAACRGIEQQLDAVLARVAGAADEHRDAGDVRWQQCIRGGRRPSASPDTSARARGPLDGEHREVIAAVDHVGVEIAGVGATRPGRARGWRRW